MPFGGRALDIEKLRELWQNESPVPDPLGYDSVVRRLEAMGYRYTEESWHCGGATVTDLTVRSLLHTFGEEAIGGLFEMIPEPSAIDRLAQIAEDNP